MLAAALPWQAAQDFPGRRRRDSTAPRRQAPTGCPDWRCRRPASNAIRASSAHSRSGVGLARRLLPSRPASAHIRAVAARLKLVNRQIKAAHRRLDALCTEIAKGEGETPSGQQPEQRDATILRSLPGVGRIVLATLLAEACEPLRRRDYHALRTLSGDAPVTRRSGKRQLP
jgi:hypothetical protein